MLAVYNGSGTLQRTLNSIGKEKTSETELIVIDGGSTDGTADLLRLNAALIDYWVSEPDKGIYNAWNKGLEAATGEWICFMGADDWYEPGGVGAYLSAARDAQDDVEYISSLVRYHPSIGASETIGKAWRWPDFQRHMTVAHVGSLHRRSLYGRLGVYDESYRICGDYELLLRARGTLRAVFLPVLTAHMGGGGFSNNLLARVYAETCRAKRDSGGRPAMLCVFERLWDYFRARVKRLLQALKAGVGN